VDRVRNEGGGRSESTEGCTESFCTRSGCWRRTRRRGDDFDDSLFFLLRPLPLFPLSLSLLPVSVELFITCTRRHHPPLPPPPLPSHRMSALSSPSLPPNAMQGENRSLSSLPGAISSPVIGRGKGEKAVLFCQPSATLRKGARLLPLFFLFLFKHTQLCLLPRTAAHSTCRSSRPATTSLLSLARCRREGVRNRRKKREEEAKEGSRRGGGIASTSRANRCVPSPCSHLSRC
jgi:hypothetical protein